MGLAYLTKTRLQNALDAAALSGAKTLILSSNAALATTAALNTFNLNNVDLNGSPAPTVETSPTLTPFTSGGANPRFLRVSLPALPVTAYFARVLPDMGETFNVGGVAVAGPEPLGGEICRALPVVLCGTPGDSDCSDGRCFGLIPNPLTGELEMKGNNTSLGPGNYGLAQLSCTGAACLREGMAGGRNFCFEPGENVTTEPGVSSGPTSQGLNTRFGVYNGPVSSAQYPPDVVTTNLPVPLVTPNYAAYLASLALPGSWNFPNGVPQRRVVPVPVVDCSTRITGRTNVAAIGSACVFLTRQVQSGGPNAGTIYGQLIGSCLTSGGSSEVPPPNPNAFQIVLYQNPGGP